MYDRFFSSSMYWNGGEERSYILANKDEYDKYMEEQNKLHYFLLPQYQYQNV